MSLASRQIIVPAIVACALFMQNLDSTIIATALPAIAHSLGEPPLRLSLAITAYLLSLAIFIPLSGWAADRFGARTVFRAAIVIFTLGSVGCGLAQSLPVLVAARILQGMGGAMMVPVGRLVLLRLVPKSDLVRAMSYLAVPALIGPAIGPPLGGFIAAYGSWRWIFFINVPIGVFGIVLVSLFIENIREEKVTPLDLRGFFLAGIGLAALIYGFEALGRGGLPGGVVVALLLIGAAGVALYVRHARRVTHPVIDLALLRIPTFSVAIIGSMIFRIGIDSLPFLVPLMLQLGFGLNPFASGLLTVATSAGAMTMKMSATPIIRNFGFRQTLIGNAAIAGLFLMSYGLLSPGTPRTVIFIMLLAGGFFRSLQMTATNTLVFADVPPAAMSHATSFSSMVQQLAGSIGVGTAAMLLNLIMVLRGGSALDTRDFALVFVVNGAICLLAILVCRRLTPDAGAELSGHRPALATRKPAE